MSATRTRAAEATAPPASDDPGGLRDWLLAQVAGLLRLPVQRVPTDRPLAGLGLDSLLALQLYGSLEERFGLLLDPAVIWDHPTVDLLAGYLGGLGDADGGGAGEGGRS